MSFIISSAPFQNVKAIAEDHRRKVARICESLDVVELAGVLKGPFCVGEAQKLVLAELEKKLEKDLVKVSGHKFDGDVWKFVEQAPRLGFSREFLDQPAKRPQLTNAIAELGVIQAKANKKP